MSIDLFQQLRTVLRRYGLEDAGLLVALSGGADSVCLARLAASLVSDGITVELAHVDHGLRPESGEDAAFCRALAHELGLAFHLKTLTPVDYRPGENLQAEGRRLRQVFFENTRKTRGLSAVLLAHHADDQAETVLFRLLRGTGPRGAGAMRVWDAPWLRPLLDVRRETMERHNREQGWPWREDPTNRTDKYARNRVRRELLPLAEAIRPGAADALTRFAKLAREDDALLTELAHAELDRLAMREPEGLRFPVEPLLKLAPALRRRLYLAGCRQLGAPAEALSLDHLEAVDALLAEGKPHRRAPAPGPLVYVRSYNSLWIMEPEKLQPPPPSEVRWGIDAGVCGKDDLPEGALRAPLPEGRPMGEVRFRSRRPGDRLGERKVKDLFMEAKMERWRRSRALIAGDDEGVLAVFADGRAWGLGDDAGPEVRRLWFLSARDGE